MTLYTDGDRSPSEAMLFERSVGEELNNYYKDTNAQVASQYRFGNNRTVFTPDYSIFIPGQVDPILAIEVKCKPNDQVIARMIEKTRLLRSFRDGKTRLLLATTNSNGASICYYDLSDYIQNEEPFQALSKATKLDRLPVATSLRNEAKANKLESEKKTITAFKIACWVLSSLGVVLLILNYFKLYQLTWENLAVIAAVVVLILLPFFDVIKFREVSLEVSDSRSRHDKNSSA